jgi:hypothetical protein
VPVKLELKRLDADSIANAIKRAEHYRLLNEPLQAESICLDVLECEPRNQRALILLLLARTDQFGEAAGTRVEHARQLLPKLESAYDRSYYAGIICERWARAMLRGNSPGAGPTAYDWLHQAMGWYEKAQALGERGNDDPVLRWNSCARQILREPHVRPAPDEGFHPLLE